ncbi:MAG: helix-turn-helix domain-containing protein [Rhizorhabdus sp.]
MEAAKARGAYKGGKVRINPDTVRSLLAEGVRPAHVARQLGISRGTVYRYVDEKAKGSTGQV